MKINAVFLFSFVCFLSLAAEPADAQNGGWLTDPVPGKGRFFVETGLTPGGDKVIHFDQIQLRYLLTDRVALRLGFQWDKTDNFFEDKDSNPSYAGTIGLDEKTRMWGVSGGMQWRILKNTRVSPYVGFDFSYRNRNTNAGYVNSTYSGSNSYMTTILQVEGAWRRYVWEVIPIPWGYYTGYVAYYDQERSFRSWSANAILGSDFYFVKHVYIGFEVALGFESIRYKPVRLEEITHSQTNIRNISPPSRSGHFGFAANPMIRFGFWF